eukprot:TRINITY_DN4526_c0_g4_i1.p1 TRINITY_DN4526_c0_g4~~TRINITY_DN4526_c0_g4_i1.p1  ORF type:complete len:167 (+),score=28.01 TRINITY_DN4526_c0_g4_i1:363-863(+)
MVHLLAMNHDDLVRTLFVEMLQGPELNFIYNFWTDRMQLLHNYLRPVEITRCFCAVNEIIELIHLFLGSGKYPVTFRKRCDNGWLDVAVSTNLPDGSWKDVDDWVLKPFILEEHKGYWWQSRLCKCTMLSLFIQHCIRMEPTELGFRAWTKYALAAIAANPLIELD